MEILKQNKGNLDLALWGCGNTGLSFHFRFHSFLSCKKRGEKYGKNIYEENALNQEEKS